MRLIDADALLSKGQFVVQMNDFGEYFVTVEEINKMPTVDAVPVVHGEWVEKWRFKPNGTPYHKIGDMECSVCHSDMLGRYYSRYCPHCGARMDGKEKTDE